MCSVMSLSTLQPRHDVLVRQVSESILADPFLFLTRNGAYPPFNTHRPASAANASGSLQTAQSKVLRTSVLSDSDFFRRSTSRLGSRVLRPVRFLFMAF